MKINSFYFIAPEENTWGQLDEIEIHLPIICPHDEYRMFLETHCFLQLNHRSFVVYCEFEQIKNHITLIEELELDFI